jgi:UDP-N-acetylglucosamine 2-epimerase (non-hydrolysing)
MNKYCIIFGTRPEYLKLKSVIDEFSNRKINHTVIYVLQHENIEEDIDNSFKKLIICNNIINRLSNIGSEILNKLPELISDCTHILIQGDTATAFYGALVGFQLGKCVIHIEAGLRTYDLTKPFPEEGYRQMISRISNIHFTPHDDCVKLLEKENVNGKIINVGNTILDLINSYNFECKMENIVIITFHRRENWNEVDNLLIGLNKLIKITPEIKYLWYLHPNPELQTKVKNNIKNLSNIQLMNPCKHIEFVSYLSKCNFVITDSGGIQEEASFLGKHCIVLRCSTERTHIPKDYITVLEDYTQLDKILYKIPDKELPNCTVYGNGFSSMNILDIIENLQVL